MTNRKSTNNIEDSFYKELDEKKSHNSCCTCQTFIFFFLGLFLLTCGGVVFVYLKIKEINPKFNNQQVKIADVNFELIESDTSFVITNDQLSTMVNKGLQIEDLVVKDVKTSITESGVIFYGTATRPLKAKIIVETIPEVKDGRIYFKVVKMQAGNLTVPNFLSKKYEELIDNSFSKILLSVYSHVRIEKIELKQNKMILTGKKK